MTLDEVADDLYGLPLDRFVAGRTERERAAKDAGEAVLAKQIHALPKPNLVGWLANLLSRRAPDELEPFLALGAELRGEGAVLTGDGLREFNRQKSHLVRILVQQARSLSIEEGRPASAETLRGLETTLNAAIADDDAAAALRAGRLTTGLTHSGFGPVPAGLASVTPLRPGTAGGPVPTSASAGGSTGGSAGGSAGGAAAAAHALAAARRSEQDAATRLAQAQAAADAAALASAAAEEDVARLREGLAQAERSAAQAAGERRRTRKDLDRAERLAVRATGAAAAAQARFDSLS